MNHTEYRKKSHPEDLERSWPLTIGLFAVALIVIAGIFAAWRYLDHDLYLVFSVLLPASLFAVILIVTALNGRRRVIKDVLSSLVDLIWFWQ